MSTETRDWVRTAALVVVAVFVVLAYFNGWG